jgi:hypothetical protein
MNRRRLGFTEQVLSSFGFLIKDYGFCVVKDEPTFVRYESSSVFVNIYHGRTSYELGFEIGRLDSGSGQEEQAYSISMIMELMRAKEPTFFQASTRDRVKEFVPRLADLVRTYATSLLQGDVATFGELIKTRLDMADRLHNELRLRGIRQKAANAWRSRDFVKVAELYDSIFENLTQAEIKKLNYAKAHLP